LEGTKKLHTPHGLLVEGGDAMYLIKTNIYKHSEKISQYECENRP